MKEHQLIVFEKLFLNLKTEAKQNQQRQSGGEGKPERTYNKFSNNENREERNNRRNRDDKQFNGPPVESNRSASLLPAANRP